MDVSTLKQKLRELDSLPYTDEEYNNPALQAMVLQEIEQEMKSLPANLSKYLKDLPTVKATSKDFENYQQIRANEAKNSSNGKKRKGKDDNDNNNEITRNLKAKKSELQYQIQQARNIMNSKIDQDETWMNYQASLDTILNKINNKTLIMKDLVNSVNSNRLESQVKVAQELIKIKSKSEKVFRRSLAVKQAINEKQAS